VERVVAVLARQQLQELTEQQTLAVAVAAQIQTTQELAQQAVAV
jgi:hypothetical protein